MPSVTGVTNPEKCQTLSDHAKNLLAVLTLASSVEAECTAWVLWDQSYAVNSFETRGDESSIIARSLSALAGPRCRAGTAT